MKSKLKFKAQSLRARGRSLFEISQILKVSKSTASLWGRDIKLNKVALTRLKNRSLNGRAKAIQTNLNKSVALWHKISICVTRELRDLPKSSIFNKLVCALLYWCEGEKTASSLAFVNSDSELVKTFLSALRGGFKIDESKFRICLHLHSYHNENKQKNFWADITGIPLKQFSKIYQKANTGLTQKKDYPGCVSIRYYDHKIAKEIECLYKVYSQHGRVV